MKKKKVWLLSGIPGSGKSTWARTKLYEAGGIWCSRDAIRFEMIKEDEEYFSRENEVFIEWIRQINEALMNPMVENVYVDATHLNDKSRNKTLNRLIKDNIENIYNVVFNIPLDVCIQRNNKRFGRSCVPEDVIKNMYKSFSMPKNYKTIIIGEDGKEINE